MLVYDFHFNKQTEIDKHSIRGARLVKFHHVLDNKPYEYVIEVVDAQGCRWYCNSMEEERLDIFSEFLQELIDLYKEVV